jgi:hypothetical protein
VPVAVMPFAGDDPALNNRIRAAALAERENLAGFIPRPLDAGGSFSDSPPDPALLEGAPYVLTGEYYFDDEDMLHFQMWLWNGANGALVYTDELVTENADEAEGYVPSLAAWVFSKIPIQRQERAVVVTARHQISTALTKDTNRKSPAPRGPGGNGSPRALKVPYPDVKA